MAKNRSQRIVKVGVAVVGTMALLVVAALSFRNPLVSFVAKRIARAGQVECDRIAIRVPLWPSTFSVEPTRCVVATGPVASIQFLEPLLVRLDGWHVVSASTSAIDVDLRTQRRAVRLNTLGDVSRAVGMEQPGVDLVLDWAALASPRMPPFRAEHAIIRRAGQRAVSLTGLELAPQGSGQSISAAAARVDQVAVLGPARLNGHSTTSRTTLALTFSDHLRIGIAGHHLDTARPTIDFSVTIGAR